MNEFERELRERLDEVQVPDRRGAEERAWNLVRASFEEREAAPRPSRLRWRALQAAMVVALAALIISPAGAAVRDWVRDTVSPGQEPSRPALTSLPAHGSLLVQSAAGPWVVHPDGSKRLLGDYASSAWSPRGLYVAVASPHELAAIEPNGEVRWTLSRAGPIRLPSWNGPDGFRIAYLDGSTLRVVDGDGTGDRLVRRGAAPVAPAWMPGPQYLVSFSKLDGGVETVRADGGQRVFATAAAARPSWLQWSADGRLLLVVRSAYAELLNREGRVVWRANAPAGARILTARLSPRRDRVAMTVTGSGHSRVLIGGPGYATRTLFAGPGRLTEVEWSPDERWVLVAWRSADQWLFLRPNGSGRIDAISNISKQFSSGATDSTTPRAPFPEIEGWCCRK